MLGYRQRVAEMQAASGFRSVGYMPARREMSSWVTPATQFIKVDLLLPELCESHIGVLIACFRAPLSPANLLQP